MKRLKIKLHIQILIGLILGIFFGTIFSIDQHSLILTSGNTKTEIENWEQITFQKGDSVLQSFGADSRQGALKYFELLRKDGSLVGTSLVVKIPSVPPLLYIPS